MADITIGQSEFTDLHWSFSGSSVAGAGGAAFFRIPWNEVIRVANRPCDNLIVDGVTMYVQITAGDDWFLLVTGSPNVAHALGTGTAPAATLHARSFFPLSLPLRPRVDAMIQVNAAFAQFDTAGLTAWGHYEPTPTEPQTVPVKVEEFHVWPPKKKVGPV